MPWSCISCKHHRHAKQQEEKIRHLEHELEIVREEIRALKTTNVGSRSGNKKISNETVA
jgi:hypothetical protein